MSVRRKPPAPLEFGVVRTTVLDKRRQELRRTRFEWVRELEGSTTEQFNENIRLLVEECLKNGDFIGAYMQANQYRSTIKTPVKAMGQEKDHLISMVKDRAREAGVELPL